MSRACPSRLPNKTLPKIALNSFHRRIVISPDEGVPLKSTRARLLLLAGLACLPALASTASRLYKLGVKAERAGNIAQAYLYYEEASAAKPRSARYRKAAAALAPQAIKLIENKSALAKAAPPALAPSPSQATAEVPSDSTRYVDLRPEAGFDSVTAAELAVDRKLMGARRLQLPDTPRDFSLTGDHKQLFSQVAEQLGDEVVFDGDYLPGKPFNFHVQGETPRQALHELEAATNSFIVPLSDKLFMVATDTEAKRKDLEQMEVAAVPMPSAMTAQEMTELGQAIRQSVGIEKMYFDPHANQLVLKDRVSRVEAAQAVLQQLTAYRAEVAMDLQFLELDESDMLNIGANLQINSPITFLQQLTSGSVGLTLTQLAKISAGQWFGIVLPSVNVTAVLSTGKTKTLFTNTLVSTDGQKATFHAGEKYPIITGQYIGSGGPSTSTQYSPAPSVTFEDLGIVVTLTPHVHGMAEMSLDLDTEFKVLAGSSNNGIPVIASRKMTTSARFIDDQWALVGGLITDSDSRNRAGVPFLARIPILGDLVSNYTRTRSRTYVLLAIRPHLMSPPPSERPSREYFLGSDTRSVTPL
jgi:general secretion pathway protein D